MKVYEITLKIFLLKDLPMNNAYEQLSELIDKSLCKDEELLTLHNENKYKYYTFALPYKLEQDKIYRAGNLYSVKIRTVDEKILENLKTQLVNMYTSVIKALTIEVKVIPKKHISTIYSITPIVIKTDNGYWKGNLSLDQYEKRIKENLIKKYNQFFNEKINEDFPLYNFIKFDNKKPIGIKYKNITLLGDKLTLNIADDEISQRMAYLALGAGLGEISSRGMGFVNYKWI
ncbi:MAG: CRISPR-associated endoribonuclease Cas6 [Clostridium argentinense]|uniref:CRISPR-associated endoribonuclease Cas6 n=1 Tax=Clostridium faecium TaxID=2762223 RepID=A0ABR8YMY2_9CLOT|nr:MULTISPECIES: CRISPR-associated endoribonuclease Cas6 [Clostridium]MBD8045575.1 CRISPR-associated endoribonuclease Cas6 [Clostridium faecium]MBS5824987.1 CRISPR-associated endoribonuclease Cas6 [Clostridium argentinense]MDU1350311.1 CRISPR-associated endoribonuclease Cas6 [Clostridium argentinense]